MKKLSAIASLALGSVLTLAPLAAFAETTVVDGDISVSPTPVSTSANMHANGHVGSFGTTSDNVVIKTKADGTNAKSRGDQEIDMRIASLNALSARLGEMKNISASEKTFLQGNISLEISNLTTLKASIDAETDLTKLQADVQSITKDYRIYMLVLPQGRVAAASDRAATIVSEMQQLSVKLSARITEAQTAGKDVSGAQSAYADMQAKISDANIQSQAALSETVNLAPDQGNATVQASNAVAIKDAIAKLKIAESDLKAARADISTILKAVAGTGASANASAGTH